MADGIGLHGSCRQAIKLPREYPCGPRHGKLLWGRRRDNAIRRLQGIRFWRARQVWFFAHDNYCELKTIWIDVSDRSVDENGPMITKSVKRLPAEQRRLGLGGDQYAFVSCPEPRRQRDRRMDNHWRRLCRAFRRSPSAPAATGRQDRHSRSERSRERDLGPKLGIHDRRSPQSVLGRTTRAAAPTRRSKWLKTELAIAFAAEAAAEYGMSRETFDRRGKSMPRQRQRGMNLNLAFGKSLRNAGEEHSFLDAAQMRELTGSDYYLGGLYTPGAVLIQPADYIRSFAAGLAKNVDLFERSPVTSLKRDKGIWTASSPRGQVSARAGDRRCQRPSSTIRIFQRVD